MPHFKYTLLTSATDEIRLLSLDPDGSLDDIQCTLETHRLDSRPVYCALSYEWGDPNLPMDITVNGNVFQARHNLWLFLHRLKAARRSQGNIVGPTSKLWIDALCIDQTDVAERSAQVQLMGKIYQEACGVIIWLGWSDGLESNVTSTLATEIASDPIYGHESYIDLSLNGPYQQIESENDATFQEIYAFMLELCKKTYWTRRWIVQEILMAKRVLLVYGEQELPWAAVCMMFERYQNYTRMLFDSKVPVYGTDLSTFYTILKSVAAKIWTHQNERRGSDSGTSLATLLQSYRSMECESLHDRVYALKGLIENGLLDTDYSISPSELYSRVFSIVLRQGRYAFRHWRNYAADCGLMVQPLVQTNSTPQEHSNAAGASIYLNMAIKEYVISTMECTLYLKALEGVKDKMREMRKDVPERSVKVFKLHKRFTGLVRFNWRAWDFPRTAVKSIHIEHGELVAAHDAILDRSDERVVTSAKENGGQPNDKARAPPIIFASRDFYDSTSQLSISWSNIELGDFLCHIFENCCLILRPGSKAIEVVGPAWMILKAEKLAELQLFIIVWNEDDSPGFRQNVQLQDVMAHFDLMDLIRLLQVHEQVMEAAGLKRDSVW